MQRFSTSIMIIVPGAEQTVARSCGFTKGISHQRMLTPPYREEGYGALLRMTFNPGLHSEHAGSKVHARCAAMAAPRHGASIVAAASSRLVLDHRRRGPLWILRTQDASCIRPSTARVVSQGVAGVFIDLYSACSAPGKLGSSIEYIRTFPAPCI